MSRQHHQRNDRYVQLSRYVSRVLRHDPAAAGLTLDAEGWVSTADLLAAVHRTLPAWQSATEDDLREMIARTEKRRHELVPGRIRALYGHTGSNGIVRDAAEPPAVLYHGTAPENVDAILRDGLLPMSRQNVHFSVDLATARAVGKRHIRGRAEPAIFVVHAVRAHAEGVVFYRGNDMTWLADRVPPTYLSLLS